MENRSEVLIYGSGALACLFAYRLARAGCSVSMLDRWQEGIHTIQIHGVRQQDVEQPVSVQAYHSPEYCSNVTLAIVLVKSWQTEQAALDLSACLAPEGMALTLQNGLGNQEILASHLGKARVVIGSTTYGATMISPGIFRPGGEGVITLAECLASAPISSTLRKAGFDLGFTTHLAGLLWAKLIINSAINPLTALLEVPNGALLEKSHAWQLVASAVEEAVQVTVARDIPLPFNDPLMEVETVLQRTAHNHSSMLQDMRRGAPTEIDAITGALLKAARELGLYLPTHETLYHLVKAKIIERQLQAN